MCIAILWCGWNKIAQRTWTCPTTHQCAPTQHLCSHFPLMSHSGQYQAWLLGRCWKSYKCRDSDKMLSFHHFPINPKLSRQWIEKFWRQVGYSFKIKQHIWYPLANFSTTSNLTSLLDITWCKLIFTYIIKIKRQC